MIQDVMGMMGPMMPLNKAHLQECVNAWASKPDASVAAVKEQTGLSRQRVSSAKEWALLGNLLDHQGLTPVGKVVLQNDPYLETTVTDWLIHFFGSLGGQRLQPPPQSPADWGIWTYFVYDFLPNCSTFTKENLIQSAAQHFDVGKLDNQLKVLLKTYTEQEAIAQTAFLTQSKSAYTTGAPNLQNIYTVGYLLSLIWQRDIGNQSSVLVDNLIDLPMGLAAVLGIEKSQLKEQFDRLAEAEVIEQRSARPHAAGQQPERRQEHEESYVVVRCWDDPLDLLQKAYDQDAAAPNRPLMQALEGILEDEDEGNLPFLSSVQNWLLNLRPQQHQPAIEGASIDPPLHLAG